ncbi:hypothetical protein [Raineya orbicola]|uniref:Tetratricopeptide repeat n=1 Tax=Raineya orbicola TaxID=2016530 RepID=A0A2N3IK48_9BACT|nr:hypothetical protein [Raineya orbicola]PKQ70651.1 hypothetical protein Rain11_0381 [Raineya orbicola]
MKKAKSTYKKIRTALLILAGLGAFYWIYFYVWGFSPFKLEEANKIRVKIANLHNQPKEIISKTFHLTLLDSSQKEQNLWNLASAYYELNQKNIALRFYDSLARSTKSAEWQSQAKVQIGNIIFLTTPQALDSALKAYKQSLYLAENNENARFNYELIRKLSQKNTPQTKEKVNSPSLPTPVDTIVELPIFKENKSQNELLEAITNQEQELLRKYFQKRTPSAPTIKNLPNW